MSVDSARIAVPEPRGAPAGRAPDERARPEAMSGPRARQARQAWLFLAPALVLLAVFTFWPVLWGSILAFTEYKIITPPTWVGLQNFEDLLDDPVFYISIRNSLLYLLIVPAIQLGAIALAVLVNNSLPGIKLF
jgi:putative chitobiose transport system permease protein